MAAVILSAFPAAAATPLLGPPESDGHWAHCNAAVTATGTPPMTGTTPTVSVACQYGPTSAVVKQFSIRFNNTAHSAALTVACSGSTCNVSTQSATGAAITRNSGGQFVMQASSSVTSFEPDLAQTGLTLTIATTTSATNAIIGPGSGCGTFDVCSYAGLAQSFAASVPTPTAYWPGGSSGTGDLVDQAGDVAEPQEGEEDCGSWVHIACHFRNAVRRAFTPSTSFSERWEDLVANVSAHYPFAPLIWGGDFLKDAIDNFKDGLEDAAPTDPGRPGQTCGIHFGFPLPGGREPAEVPVLPCSSDEGGEHLAPLMAFTVTASRIALVLSLVLGLWALFGRLVGGSSEGAEA